HLLGAERVGARAVQRAPGARVDLALIGGDRADVGDASRAGDAREAVGAADLAGRSAADAGGLPEALFADRPPVAAGEWDWALLPFVRALSHDTGPRIGEGEAAGRAGAGGARRARGRGARRGRRRGGARRARGRGARRGRRRAAG